LSHELSLAIWQRVCADATDSQGRRDSEQAERRFREIAARIAARGGRLQPGVGRLTRVETEAHIVPGGTWALDELALRTPGRTTLVASEMRRWRAYDHGSPTPLEDAGAEAGRPELPGASELKRAMAALRMPSPDQAPSPDRAPSADRAPPPDQAIPLETSVVARMGRLFDADLTDVKVVPESPEVTGATKAVTKDDQVHFRPGTYQPGTSEGDWLIAHELAHVVQQRGGHGERTGPRKEIEREADRAASLAVRDRAAPIQLRAERAAAYAFDDSEAHDSSLDDTADKEDGNASAHGGDATKADARASEPADPAGGAARAEHAVRPIPAKLVLLVDKRVKASRKAIADALHGTVTANHRFLLKLHLGQADGLQAAIDELDREVGERLDPFRVSAQRVTQVPGIADVAAAAIISEIGVDMSRFQTSAHIISWAGFCPRNDESAGKRRSTRLRKGAPWLKTLLVQCAWGRGPHEEHLSASPVPPP